MKHWLICCCCLAWAVPAMAQQETEALAWLNRLVTAAHKLNYSGTFVFQRGGRTETSRITHLLEGKRELERLEVLDGSPREVIRNNDEVTCYMPDSRTMIVEKRSRQHTFPALLPASLGSLTDYYVIRKGQTGRVAGLESQSLILEPKDELRYGHQMWADTATGLLLKAELMNERNDPIETFAFTQLQIGGPIDPQSLKSKSVVNGDQKGGWRVRNVRTYAERGDDAGWQFKVQLPGFHKMAGQKHKPRPGSSESLHIVFSDGLAAISVFIEPLASASEQDKLELGMFSIGGINVYRRIVGDHLLVVMGEVPELSLRRLGDGIEHKR